MTDKYFMRRMSDFWGKKSGTAHYGTPGHSAVLAKRSPLLFWQRMEWWKKLLTVSLLAVFGAIIGFASYGTTTAALNGGTSVLALSLILWALISSPSIFITSIVLLVTMALLPILGYFYTGAAGYPDQVGGTIALLFAYGIALGCSVRWGRGRLWVTSVLLSSSLVLPGLILLFIFPSLGLNIARLSLLSVVLFRCGGFAWISGATGLLWDRLRYGSNDEAIIVKSEIDPQDVSTAWERRALAERETADSLKDLGSSYSVFHDVSIPKTNMTIDHVVIGETGLKLLSSVHALGLVYVDPVKGLIIPGVDYKSEVIGLISARDSLAKVLRVHPRDVELILAVHGNYSFEPTTVAVMTEDAFNQRTALRIKVTSGEKLPEVIKEGFILWSQLKVKQTTRIAKMRLVSTPMPRKGNFPVEAEELEVAVLDMDGNPIIDESYSSRPNKPWGNGDRVAVQTNMGIISGLRIMGEVSNNASGVPVVKVCSEQDWVGQQNSNETELTIKCYVFPVEALIPPQH